MRNFKRRISKPSASLPAGLVVSPTVHFAGAINNMYMDTGTAAAVTGGTSSAILWVTKSALPICESFTRELCPFCPPLCQLPAVSHACCPTVGLCLCPKTLPDLVHLACVLSWV